MSKQKRSIHWMWVSNYAIAIVFDNGVPTGVRVNEDSPALLFTDEDDKYNLEVIHHFIDRSNVEKCLDEEMN